MYLREVVLSYRRRRAVSMRVDVRKPLATPSEAATVVCQLLSEEAVEVFGILCLSTKHTIIAFHVISRGSLDATLVHPREAFKAAILSNAAAVIFAHNHPSGDPAASPDDHAVTVRLQNAGNVIGIDVLDHIIAGHDGKYFSFREAGVLAALPHHHESFHPTKGGEA